MPGTYMVYTRIILKIGVPDEGKGNILHFFLGILKVVVGRRSRCTREVLELVAVP